MRSRTAWFKYRPSHPAEAGKHWARLNLARMLPLHAHARATSRRLPLLLRMELESESLTAAFDARERGPCECRFARLAEVRAAIRETPARPPERERREAGW